jgi:hypothetical protein
MDCKAPTVVAVHLKGHLSNSINSLINRKGDQNYLSMIEGDATRPESCTVEQFQEYQLKLSGFPSGPRIMGKGIQNVKYPEMVACLVS